MKTDAKSTAIIGGGASGLCAAIFIKTENKNHSVTIFERLDRVGKKLLATGNGRCNLSNKKCLEFTDENGKTMLEHYHGNDRSFAKSALTDFDNFALENWLKTLGMPVIYEGDKMFPYSLNAANAVDILRMKCDAVGVKIITGDKISQIDKSGEKYKIDGEFFDNVIVATGGKSQEKLGSDGSGYALLEKFGHKRTSLFPAITQVKTDTTFVRQVKGLKIDATCSIYVNNNHIKSEFGQVLFTDYGLSGPPIFSLSRIASVSKKECKISLDIMPDFSENEIVEMLKTIISKPFCKDLTLENLLTPILNKRVGQVVIKYCGYKLNIPANALKSTDLARISKGLKHFDFEVAGVNGFNVSQVTAGGIITSDFDNESLQSLISNNLYAIGEVLDVDGDCGGFNLQWAFASAFAAAKSITSKARKD